MENNYFGMDSFNRDTTLYCNAAVVNDAILKCVGLNYISDAITNNKIFVNKIAAANVIFEDGSTLEDMRKACSKERDVCSKEASIGHLRRSDFLTLRRQEIRDGRII